VDDELLLLVGEVAALDARPEVVGPPQPTALAAPTQTCREVHTRTQRSGNHKTTHTKKNGLNHRHQNQIRSLRKAMHGLKFTQTTAHTYRSWWGWRASCRGRAPGCRRRGGGPPPASTGPSSRPPCRSMAAAPWLTSSKQASCPSLAGSC
jgi:hypothetical protein